MSGEMEWGRCPVGSCIGLLEANQPPAPRPRFSRGRIGDESPRGSALIKYGTLDGIMGAGARGNRLRHKLANNCGLGPMDNTDSSRHPRLAIPLTQCAQPPASSAIATTPTNIASR